MFKHLSDLRFFVLKMNGHKLALGAYSIITCDNYIEGRHQQRHYFVASSFKQAEIFKGIDHQVLV